MFFIEPAKIVAVTKSNQIGNLGYWDIGARKNFSRFVQAEQGKVVNEGFSGTGFKKPAEMLNTQVAVHAHVFNRYPFAVMTAQIVQRVLNKACRIRQLAFSEKSPRQAFIEYRKEYYHQTFDPCPAAFFFPGIFLLKFIYQ